MISNKLNLSVGAFTPEALVKLSADSNVDRIHVTCVEDNYEALGKAKAIIMHGGKEVASHILMNRIDSLNKTFDHVAFSGVNSILLLRGNPHEKPFEHDMNDLINYFSQKQIGVSVGAYPVSYFGIQTKKHVKTQIDILKSKIDSGAKSVYLQSVSNYNDLDYFVNLAVSKGIDIPFHYGVSNNGSLIELIKTVKEIAPEKKLFFKKSNLDYILKKLTSSFSQSMNVAEKVRSSLYKEGDGFHIMTYDEAISENTFYLKQRLGLLKEGNFND